MTDKVESESGTARGGGLIRSPQDFAGGVFLLLIAAVGYWGLGKLDFGTLRSIGPAMLPRAASVMVALFGTAFIVSSFLTPGSALDRWRLRGPFFVLGAALLFAWTVRPLGLMIAGPLCLIFASFADRDTRPTEILIFSVVMTGMCIFVFSYLLKLPIPIQPTALPYPLDALLTR